MSYTRFGESGHYIYSDNAGVVFDGCRVLNEEIDIFLYKIILSRLDELKKRVQHGKKLIDKWSNNTDDEDKFYRKQWLAAKESTNKIYQQIVSYKEENAE